MLDASIGGRRCRARTSTSRARRCTTESRAATAFAVELRLRRADGVERWFRVFVSPIGGIGDAGWLGVCADIDDYKRQSQLFAFLAQAGEVLAESLDLQATLNRLLAIIVPDFGDWAAIDLFDEDDRLKTVAAIHADPEKSRLVKRLVGRYKHDPRYEPVIAEALRRGRPMLISDVNVDLLKKAAAHESVVGDSRAGAALGRDDSAAHARTNDGVARRVLVEDAAALHRGGFAALRRAHEARGGVDR